MTKMVSSGSGLLPVSASKSNYIEAIMPSAPQSASVSASVPRISRSGHIPIVSSSKVSKAAGIISDVSGSAMRLVRMKYCGNVPK